MNRATTDNPQDDVQTALNKFFVKDSCVWVRRESNAPDSADMKLEDYIRAIAMVHIPYAPLPDDDKDLPYAFYNMPGGVETIGGLIASFYGVCLLCAVLHTRLCAYEDTGLMPEEIEEYIKLGTLDHLRELVQAEQDGLSQPWVGTCWCNGGDAASGPD